MSNSELNNEWRRTASSLYKKPTDSKIYASAEIDVTELEAFVTKKRSEGLKITLSHLLTMIASRAIAEEVPELNCYVRRGNIVPRKQVDAMISVLVGDQMSSVLIENSDKLNLEEFAEKLTAGIKEVRSGEENETMKMKGIISKIPWPFRTWFFNFVKFLTINMGISIPNTGITANNFGSFMMTNIGSIGVDSGYPALFPISNVSFVLVLGSVIKKPIVVNDEIVIRRMMAISSTVDHRIVDAMHGGKLYRYIKRAIRNPEALETAPLATQPSEPEK